MGSLPERLKMLRKARSKNQTDISEVLGIRRSTYGEYERGIITPPSDKLHILANYYNVSVDYIIGNEKENIDITEELDNLILELNNNMVFMIEGKKLNSKVRQNLIFSLRTISEFAKMSNSSVQVVQDKK